LAWIRSLTLATGIPNGDPELEHEFAERFLPRLQSFFRARLPNSTLTEELTQDTLVAALLALRAGKLRNPQAVTPDNVTREVRYRRPAPWPSSASFNRIPIDPNPIASNLVAKPCFAAC
jgi:hypothetical protein